MMFLCSYQSALLAQDKTPPQPIIRERELLHYTTFDLKEKEVVALSPKSQMITKQLSDVLDNDRKKERIYYLSDIEQQYNKNRIADIATHIISSVRFVQNGNFISYRFARDVDTSLGFYDIQFKNNIELRNNNNRIVNASYSLKRSNILYSTKEEKPTVLFANSEGNYTRYITDGIAGEWSPDGKWFYVLKPKLFSEFERQRTQERKIDNRFPNVATFPNPFDTVSTIWIFSALGDQLFELVNYDSPALVKWSPTSDKLLIQSRNDYGFSIAELKEKIDGYSAQELAHFGDSSTVDIDYFEPSFSFDGKKILFIKSYRNFSDKRIYKEEIWIANIDGKQLYKLTEADKYRRENPIWTENGTILMTREQWNLSDERELRIIELTIENIEELFD